MASVHKFSNQAPPPPICIGSESVEGEAVQLESKEAARGNEPGASTPSQPALLATSTHAKRKVRTLRMRH